MILYPAIDLKDGTCVRLRKGDMDKATVFSDNPAAQAKLFQEQGAEWLHVVDLNGAFEGEPMNADAVTDIIRAIDIPIQLGGGIRHMDTIETWIDAGVKRVVLGTIAAQNPELVHAACRAFPGQIAVGIDAKKGFVAVQGWAEETSIPARDLALMFEASGVAAIIYTDIDRDGVMEGPNLESIKAIAESLSTPIIASGGVSNMDDLRALKAIESSGINGVISGRAVYEGMIDIRAATKLLS